MNNAHKHLTLEERRIIETGIRNGSSKTAIAMTLGKDKSTVCKEINLRRVLKTKCKLPLECAGYKKCKHDRQCTSDCLDYVPFTCKRRDRSPGACNGCENLHKCRFSHWVYVPEDAEHEYRQTLISSRQGINITDERLKEIGGILAPQIKRGKSVYAILQAHPEIELSEKTIYNYIESGAFHNVGIPLCSLDLRRQTSRKITRRKSNLYKIRNDRSFLKGRLYTDFESYIQENPNVSVVEMDTVYNDVSNGPFMQTFRFRNLGILFIVYHDTKSAQEMYQGILYLEEILGQNIFDREVNVILTDRGSEFTMADQTETRPDGKRRTRIFYCDPMRSNQKGSLENQHELIRYVCPHVTDLRELGLTDQKATNKLSSHINSYYVESLRGKSPFQYASFMAPDLVRKLFDSGLQEISLTTRLC